MATTTPVSDFVNVQLTPAGAAYAGAAGTLSVRNGASPRFDYTWKAGGQPVRMLTSEWRKHFSKQTFQGKPIFEIAPGPSIADLKNQEQQIQQQIAADEAAAQK